jgi:RNA polymerase sigma factor (sigma-70 family)
MGRPGESERPDALADLVRRASAGDEAAWTALYWRVKDVVWKIINGYGQSLSRAEAEDAFAATMFRLVENLGTSPETCRIEKPDRLPGWLATTARNETMTIFRSRRRTTLVDDVGEYAVVPGEHERGVVLDELQEAMRAALANLSDRCRWLLSVWAADPPMTYEQIGQELELKHGSISKALRDCKKQLRAQPELRPYLRERTA